MDRQEQILRSAGTDAQVQMKLIARLKVGNFQKNRSPSGQNMGRSNGKLVVPRSAEVPRGEFRRAVSGAVAVIPCLGELAARLTGRRPLDGQSERNANAILINVEAARKLDGLAGIANALHATVRDAISPPATHAASITLTVSGVEPAA